MKYTKIKEHMAGMPLMTMEGQTKIVAIFKGDDKKYTVCTMDGLYLFYERNIEDSKLDWKRHCPINCVNNNSGHTDSSYFFTFKM